MQSYVYRYKLRYVLGIFLVVLFAASAFSQTGSDQGEDVDPLEVELEAYSSGFYRPILRIQPGNVDTLDVFGLTDAGKRFIRRLHFAFQWSGYVNLELGEEIQPGAADTSARYVTGPPPTILRLDFFPYYRRARVRASLSEPGEEAYYETEYDFDKFSARWVAETLAEDILFSMTGMRPPFRSQIACVQRRPDMIKEIVVVAFDGGKEWTLTLDNSLALSPSWSPDGRRLVFSSFKEGEDSDLFIVRMQDQYITPLVTRLGTDAAPSWSPGGQWIAFAASDGFFTDLMKIRPNGRNMVNLTNSSSINTSPDWSPTGREIVFVSDRSGSPQIYRMDADGANLARLTYEGSYNSDPSWSPGGDHIAFSRREDSGFQIYLMDINGDVTLQLTTDPGDHLEPAWSPDGMKISYTWRDKLWVMNTDGTEKRELLVRGLMAEWSRRP